MITSQDVLARLTRKELLVGADRLGMDLPDRGSKSAVVSALLGTQGAFVAVVSLTQKRVRALAVKLGLPEARSAEDSSLRQRLGELARGGDATENAAPEVGANPFIQVETTEQSESPHEIAARLEWRSGHASPTGRRVLDVSPGTKGLLSASADPEAAHNVMADEAPDIAGLATARPEDCRYFDLGWRFDADEVARIRRGFRPSAMEDKWRIVSLVEPEGLRVCFLRSWTNRLLFVLEIRDGMAIQLLSAGGVGEPRASARAILDGYLLDRACVVPGLPSQGTDAFSLMTHGIAFAGRRCDYVEPASSRAWFPSHADLAVRASEERLAIERRLPREVFREGDDMTAPYGMVNVYHAVTAMLEPVRDRAAVHGAIPHPDAVIDHDRVNGLRRWLSEIAAMNELQLRHVAFTPGFDRNGLPAANPSEAEPSYRDVTLSHWLVWGRGEIRGDSLRARMRNRPRQWDLLAWVRDLDPAFALGVHGWILELVATGADLLTLLQGEGNVRGWMVAGPASDVTEPLELPTWAHAHPSTAAWASAIEGRRRGALVGLAVGDALGAAVEFKPPGSFPPVTGYRDGGPHGLAPGEWTDDTSMALALADSLAFYDGDLADQGRRYLAWWREGKYSVNGRCFDIGIATREALARILEGTDAASAGDSADNKSGNGSIMRIAPIAIRYLDSFPADLRRLDDRAAQSSLVTHGSRKCVSACRYLAAVLAALIGGAGREEVLAPNWPVLEELHRLSPLDPAILDVARGSYRRKKPPEIRGSGYVVESLEASLWAFYEAPTFRDAVLAAVNLGDDNTTGAICGQLAGAFFGIDGIPAEWLKGLAKREWIEDAVRRLGEAHTVPSRPPSETPPSYVHAASPSPAAHAHANPIGETAPRPVALVLADANANPPVTRCYWVVQGLLAAGAYPGNADKTTHAERLTSLWNAGIRTFVSLMEERETNNAGQPFTAYAETVAAIAARTGERAACVRFPIVDVSIPSEKAMTTALDYIDEEIAANRPVYVHCFGGIGRTGTTIGCWLLRHGLASPENVVDVLKRLREKDAERASRRSPETAEQLRFMTSWKRG